MKIKNILLILSSFLIIFFFNIARISASSYQISYTIEKYGSTQTSIADAYFEKPATVTVGQGQYTVSMTVKTSHDLGSFPVQILNVNGQAPQISKTTSGNEDYYTFSFTTQSVKKTMSGNMKVDIDSMNYHHTYGFNIALNADSVPDLTSGTSSSTTVAQTVTESSSSASTTSQNNSSAATSSTSSEKTSISNSISSSSSSTSENSSSSSMNSSSKKNNKTKNNKKGSKKSNTSRKKESKKSDNTGKKIVGGVSAIVVALGIGFGIWRRIHY